MKFCSNPFDFYEVNTNGTITSCCPSWLKTPIGTTKNGNMYEIFNSDAAQKIRESIHDGTFSYCDHDLCPKLQDGSLPDSKDIKNPRHRKIIDNKSTIIDRPTFINLSYDASCNLRCPSCRIGGVSITKGPEYNRLKSVQDQILKDISTMPEDHVYMINITGSGDPFGSKLFRDFLFELDGTSHPNLQISLQTNGVMFTPSVWDRISKIHNNLYNIIVSLDAATEQTYDVVRIGGNWNLLLENLNFLGQKRLENMFKYLRVDFVVQRKNYLEMPTFVDMFIHEPFYVDNICFSKLTNWGTWSDEDFVKENIFSGYNQEHAKFLEVMKHQILGHEKVILGNIASYRK